MSILQNEDDKKVEAFGLLWWICMSGILLGGGLYLMCQGGSAAGTGFGLLIGSGYMMKYGKPLGKALARCQILVFTSVGHHAKGVAEDQARKRAERERIERERERKLIEARETIDKRLTLIDGNLRNLESETDGTRRGLFLQNALDQSRNYPAKVHRVRYPPMC